MSPATLQAFERALIERIAVAVAGSALIGLGACAHKDPFGGCTDPTTKDVTYVRCGTNNLDDAGHVVDGGVPACMPSCRAACDIELSAFSYCKDDVETTTTEPTTVHAHCTYVTPCGGRLTDGIAKPRPVGTTTELGTELAHMAWMEAASVLSFRRL